MGREMFVKLHKISMRESGEYYLSEVVLNTAQIVYMVEDAGMNSLLYEGKIDIGLNTMTRFTKIRLSDRSKIEEITVVGDTDMRETKMMTSKKKLLRG